MSSIEIPDAELGKYMRLKAILANRIQPEKNLRTEATFVKIIEMKSIKLKRGGSDYTASLIAAAIQHLACEIWTDHRWMHNNDPRVVDPLHVLN